jgi:hypothetical protein
MSATTAKAEESFDMLARLKEILLSEPEKPATLGWVLMMVFIGAMIGFSLAMILCAP